MANIVLLKIGTSDLTDYIDIQSYNVNNTEEYTEWTDANHVKHRDVLRTRLSGSINLGFRSAAEVTSFLSVLSSNVQAGNYYPAQVFSNDDNTLHQANIFIEGDAEIKRDLINGRVWHQYAIEITER